jgi:hypothetical protein
MECCARSRASEEGCDKLAGVATLLDGLVQLGTDTRHIGE